MTSDVWTLGAVGDVFVHRPDFDDAFTHSRDMLRAVDLLSGNCEGAFTDRPSPSPGAGWVVMSPRAYAAAFGPAGFDVMSVANNHVLDGGYVGLDDTLGVLREQGIATVGAGTSLHEARAPAIIDKDGRRVGFLSFSSVHPPGYAARRNMPGVAAIRVHAIPYMSDDNPYGYIEPGTTPNIATMPWREDVAMMMECVAELKRSVDVVVGSFHWGSSRLPVDLLDYERSLAHSAVEAGCDVVIGHHHHFLRGIEIYHGKPIFYGLGHFVFDQKTDWSEAEIAYLTSLGDYGIYPREGYPLLPFHADARMTMMVVVEFSGKAIRRCGFVPCVISPGNHAIPAAAGSPEYERVRRYVLDCSRAVGFASSFAAQPFKVGDFDAIEVCQATSP